jgi:arginase
MAVRLIQVPYMAGDDRHPASEGPRRFVEAGADTVLAAKHIAVSTAVVERGGPFRDTASASMAVCKQLAAAVGKAIVEGQVPLVLAGSCDISAGILAGFQHDGCGVVWIDAHGDFNTPESTITGFFPGMSLALITGHCYRNYWAQIGNNSPVSEAATVVLGVRDLDPAERERFERSAIKVVAWHEGRSQGDVAASFDELREHVQEVYLHIDMDALDPQVAPGIVDHPVPGGLSLEDLNAVIAGVGARFQVRAATLATYDPGRDQDDKTLRAGLSVIELLGKAAGNSRPVSAA